MPKTFCPQCGTELKADSDETLHCTKCNEKFKAVVKEKKTPVVDPDRRITAGILAILLGALGIHKFYLGYNTEGIIMLLISLLTCGFGMGIMGIIALIEGIRYLAMSDAEFDKTYVAGRKGWF